MLAVSTQRGARGVPRGAGGRLAGLCAVLGCVGARGAVWCTQGAPLYTWADAGRQWAGAESEAEASVGEGAEVKVKTPEPLELQGQPPGLCPEGPGPARSPRWKTGEGSSRPSLTPWCLSWDVGGQARWGKRNGRGPGAPPAAHNCAAHSHHTGPRKQQQCQRERSCRGQRCCGGCGTLAPDGKGGSSAKTLTPGGTRGRRRRGDRG